MVVFVAASHDFHTVNQVPMPLLPGSHFFENMAAAWEKGNFDRVMLNSLIVAGGVTAGKIAIAGDVGLLASSISATGCAWSIFWLIFITLMLPLEVRIVPTYAVAAERAAALPVDPRRWPGHRQIETCRSGHLLNTYSGLILPLVATATGTFLYRQFFLTVPDELTEAAKMDGAGPIRFFFDILLPLSRANMAALATIMFVWAWNQYLWPLLIITDHEHYAHRDDATAEDRARPAVRRSADLERRHGRQL